MVEAHRLVVLTPLEMGLMQTGDPGWPLSDDVERWFRDARGQSREALGRLLETCRDYLLLVANDEMAGDLRAKAGASDLVQDTFLEAQRNFPQFGGRSLRELKIWLRRILLNNLADLNRRYRETARRCLGQEVSLDADDSADNAGAQVAADDTLTPSGQAIRHEQAAALEQALARLPELYRQVIVWRHLENRSFAEIGALLGRTPDAARMLWARAVKELQKIWEGRS
jgi:RNA polymerase sigma-70 factor, ECF subfamily